MLEQQLINPSLNIGIEIFVGLVVIMFLEAALFATLAFALSSILDPEKNTEVGKDLCNQINNGWVDGQVKFERLQK